MTTDATGRGDDALRRWLRAWEACIRGRDYDGARSLFDEDVVSFGTLAVVARGLDALVADQWRNTWPHIEGFAFDHDGLTAVLSPDGGLATLAVTWRSVGHDDGGVPFERPGRATVTLRRDGSEDGWRAVHTHFSLNLGVPAMASHRPGSGRPAS